MNIIRSVGQVIIQFGSAAHRRAKALFIIEAIVAMLGSIAFFWFSFEALNSAGDYTIFALFTFAFAVICGIYSFRFLNKVFNKESLVITPNALEIIVTNLFNKKSDSFRIANITHLTYTGYQKYVDHPLKGESMDYLGFQTQQEVINTVQDEGNISFFYEGKTVHFGKGVYSWHVEEIEIILREMGVNLRFEGLSREFIMKAPEPSLD